MSIAKQELNFLTNTLMKEVAAYGILEISLGQYQTVCKKIVAFAHSSDTTFYDSDLPDRFVLHINNQIKEGSICPEYGRFQKRNSLYIISLLSCYQHYQICLKLPKPP